MTKYKLISNADTVKAGGVLFTWKNATQETLAKALSLALSFNSILSIIIFLT